MCFQEQQVRNVASLTRNCACPPFSHIGLSNSLLHRSSTLSLINTVASYAHQHDGDPHLQEQLVCNAITKQCSKVQLLRCWIDTTQGFRVHPRNSTSSYPAHTPNMLQLSSVTHERVSYPWDHLR